MRARAFFRKVWTSVRNGFWAAPLRAFAVRRHGRSVTPAACSRNPRQRESGRPPAAVANGTRVNDRVAVRKTYKLYVNGAFIRSESGRTDSVGGENVVRGSRKDVRDAVVGRPQRKREVGGQTPSNRGLVLYRLAEMMEARAGGLAEQLVQGGTVTAAAARREVDAAIDRTVWYAGWCDKYVALASARNPVSGPALQLFHLRADRRHRRHRAGRAGPARPGHRRASAAGQRQRRHRRRLGTRSTQRGRLRRVPGDERPAGRRVQRDHRNRAPSSDRRWPATWTSMRCTASVSEPRPRRRSDELASESVEAHAFRRCAQTRGVVQAGRTTTSTGSSRSPR